MVPKPVSMMVMVKMLADGIDFVEEPSQNTYMELQCWILMLDVLKLL